MSDRDCDNCAHHSEGGCSVWECSFTPKEDDSISRQAAIGALCGECQANCIPCESFPCGEIKAVQALPSAQPNLQPTCNNLATDCISRQAAIDAVKRNTFRLTFAEEQNCEGHVAWSAEAIYSDVIEGELLELPPAQPDHKWIPCSERLPKEEERRYWVCTDTGYQCQCRWTNDVYGFGASDRWEWKIFDIPQYQKVVAWMPLPEPYTERRTDDERRSNQLDN